MERVRAVELTMAEAAAFYRDVLAPYVEGLPWPGRLAGSVFAGDALRDPDGAALEHPVFELIPAEPNASPAPPRRSADQQAAAGSSMRGAPPSGSRKVAYSTTLVAPSLNAECTARPLSMNPWPAEY